MKLNSHVLKCIDDGPFTAVLRDLASCLILIMDAAWSLNTQQLGGSDIPVLAHDSIDCVTLIEAKTAEIQSLSNQGASGGWTVLVT